jgi:flagellum-specific peptidoglycan hydrolase FlgJ
MNSKFILSQSSKTYMSQEQLKMKTLFESKKNELERRTKYMKEKPGQGDPYASLVGYDPSADNKTKISYAEAYKYARDSGAKFPSVVASQFGLESGWGTRTGGIKNNFFNIKWNEASADKMLAKGIKVKKSSNAATDNATKSKDYYMEFETPEDSFKGYQTFIEVNPRYKKALESTTAAEYLQELKNAGYAEDVKYVSKITTIMSDNEKNIPETKTQKLSPLLDKFKNKIEDLFGKEAINVISSENENSIEIKPNQKIYDYLQNTKEGLELLKDHGLAFTDKSNQTVGPEEIYNSSFNISKDNGSVSAPDERLARMNLPDGDKNQIKPYSVEDVLSRSSNKDKDEIIKEYKDRKEAILNDKNITLTEKNEKLSNLNKEVSKNGNASVINRHEQEDYNLKIDQYHKEVSDFTEGKTEAGALYNLMQVGDFRLDQYGGFQLDFTPSEYDKIKSNLSDDLKKQIKRVIRGTKKEGHAAQYQLKNTEANGAYNFLNKIERPYQDITGNTLFMNLGLDPNGGYYGEMPATQLSIKNAKVNFENASEDKLRTPELVQDTSPEQRNKKEATGEDKVVAPKKEVAGDPSKNDASVEDVFSNFFKKDKIPIKEEYDYNAKDFGLNIPYGAIGNFGLAMKGLEDADEKIPLRTEQVSDAIIEYAKNALKLSRMGLAPEEEAKMKSDIADNYSEGITRLTRASNGNRNLILGNLSGLNRTRLKGILDISLADVEAKARGAEQYGQTLQFIENFNTNRDVANHEIKFNEAQRKRTGGEDLASAGFTQMLDDLQFAKENGPGSANHRVKTAINMELHGYVPGLKDNGTGQPGTYSAFKNMQAGLRQANDLIDVEESKMNQIKADYYALSSDERAGIGDINNYINQKFTESNIVDPPRASGVANPKKIEPVNPTTTSQDPSFYDGDTFYDDQGNPNRLHMFDAEEKGNETGTPLTGITGKPVNYDTEPAVDATNPTGYSYGRAIRSNVQNEQGQAVDSLYMANGGKGRWNLNYARNAADSTRGARLNEQFADQLLTEDELSIQKALNAAKHYKYNQ